MFFYRIDKYTLVQTNVNNKKTETEIMQSQTKNKTSLPYCVHVMRDKIQNRHLFKKNVTSGGLQIAL